MRLGLTLGSLGGAPAQQLVALAAEAERLNFHSVWTAEAYGSDAVVPLAWVAAHTTSIGLGTSIMQMPARTPANTAMTAATLDLMSEGRVLLGLGLSGPQVVEGWHGQPYGRPLRRTREYVEIVRAAVRRSAPLEYHGGEYDVPYAGADATGLGKPLKLILRPRRNEIPIYLAAIGPRNVELAFEIGDGWLPFLFAPAHARAVYGDLLDGARPGFDIAPTVPVVLGDDVDACRDQIRPLLALYVGGMGAKGRNFYNDLVCRYGYADAAARIQALYLDGKSHDAARAVPDELVDDVALCGPKHRIRDLLEQWRSSPATTMIVGSSDTAALKVMADLVL